MWVNNEIKEGRKEYDELWEWTLREEGYSEMKHEESWWWWGGYLPFFYFFWNEFVKLQVTDKESNVEGSESDATYRNKGLLLPYLQPLKGLQTEYFRLHLPPIIVLFYSASIQPSALGSSCGRGRMKGFKADHLLLLWGAWRHDA